MPHMHVLILFSRTFGTRPGGDVMVGMVPEGAKCGTNMVNIYFLYKYKYT